MKLAVAFFLLLNWIEAGWAQAPAQASAQASNPGAKPGAKSVVNTAAKIAPKQAPNFGRVVNDGAAVYRDASFDSEAFGYLEQGKLYNISRNIYGGAFYRILVKPGVIGYVADSDIKPIGAKKTADGASAGKDGNKGDAEEKKPPRRKLPFQYTQYFGLEYANIRHRENTMGQRPSQSLGFFGLKIFGPNLVLEGLSVTEMNFLIYPNAPSYYKDTTGKDAAGWIFMADILFQMVTPHGKNTVTYFGFGPLLKYSKYDVELQDATTSSRTRYSLEDINIGAAFNLGLGFRFNRFALRAEYQFYWEQLNYSGFAIALQRDF